MVPLVRGLLVSDIFDKLPDDVKDAVSDKVLQWVEGNLRAADAKSFPTLVALLNYHQEDIAKAVWWIVKPGFRPVAELIASLFAVAGQGSQQSVDLSAVDVKGAELGEDDVKGLKELVLAMVVKEDMKPRFEKAVSAFESLKPEERVARTVKFVNYMIERQRKAGSRQAAAEFLELLKQYPEPWIYMLYMLRPEKRTEALRVFLAVLEKSVELSSYIPT
jgi:hypothetical protein